MADYVDKTYELMSRRRGLRIGLFVIITAAMALIALRLDYKEDITDFLPIDKGYQDALHVYEDISGGDRAIAIFMSRDTAETDADEVAAAIDDFAALAEQNDTLGMIGDVMTQIDDESIGRVTEFVYSHIAHFLTPADYARIDSLMANPTMATEALQADKNMLMMPFGGGMTETIVGHDPLGLFAPAMERLSDTDSDIRYELYDGYLFSPDMSRGIVIISSNFGAMESAGNGELSELLQQCADKAMELHPDVEIHLTGGPIIAANNSGQIKTDSIVSVAIALTLIVALLLTVFGGVREMALICLSVLWGWIFALGGLACVSSSVSVIVIGMSSVIIGIAVNYPLHYLSHLQHTPDRRRALGEIAAPLVVGNVTTVGAFMALVPLKSVALSDLGIFAALMLVGTMLFVLIFLPHISRVPKAKRDTFVDRLSRIEVESKPAFVACVCALTLILAFFSVRTEFDSNIGNINYMTPQQEEDIEYFEREMSQTGPARKVYALATDTTANGALALNESLRKTITDLKESGIATRVSYTGDFLCSRQEQEKRIAMWEALKTKYGERIKSDLSAAADAEGFTESAFAPFADIMERSFAPQDIDFFAPLTQSLFAANVSADSTAGRFSIVSIVDTDEERYEEVKARLTAAGAYSFDVGSLNSAVADKLSDDFNYIGWACGLIVFIFLWLSFRSIELAVLSFVPMAVSWVWILGIMGLLGIKFNIVNIILATFIFGQGDDYTIFMTEGAMYEYAHRRKMLASYKGSIIVSALIMFIGIGTLIVAKHHALRSLAEVTIAGMTSVVLMAYIFPPLIFRMLVSRKGEFRLRPISVGPLFAGMVYRVSRKLGRPLMPGVTIYVENIELKEGAVLVSTCDIKADAFLADIIKKAGLNCPILTTEEIQAQRSDNKKIINLSIFGSAEAREAGNPCLYPTRVAISLSQSASPKEADSQLRKAKATALHFVPLVKDRYRYKGDIYAAVCSNLRKNDNFASEVDVPETCPSVTIRDNGHGEIALLYSLVHPSQRVTAIMANEESAEILRHSAEGVATNLSIVVER